jgi:putative DNA methylase
MLQLRKSLLGTHPSTLHLWWARRPLAAARAVIFCQMVDDPSAVPEEFPTEEAQENERLRLFALISEMARWENSANNQIQQSARAEIFRSWQRACSDNSDHPQAADLFNPEKLPGFHDPFAGGGALPLEAQRLGLESYASDLNPVAVLINKAMIEIPPKFAGLPPVNPESRRKLAVQPWSGTQGLAEDLRYYGQWMREEAEKRISRLYPQAEVTDEMVKDRPDLKPYTGKKLTVIAWIWARTVNSPNPAFAKVKIPLASTFMLSTKAGKEAYVEPVIDGDSYHFTVRVGKPENLQTAKNGTKADGRGANFYCLMSQSPIPSDYLKSEGAHGRIDECLMAIVAEGNRERVYLAPNKEHEEAAKCSQSHYKPNLELPKEGIGRTAFWCKLYGLTDYGKLFTQRQLVALTTFSDLVQEAREKVKIDAQLAGLSAQSESLDKGGHGAEAYSEAVSIYLAFALNRVADRHSSIATWDSSPANLKLRNTFARQAIPMTWDFGEGNPFCMSSGTWSPSVEFVAKSIECIPGGIPGQSSQADASTQKISAGKVVSTDPPYFDNIGYADLSDYFYIWLRRSLRTILPDLFATLAVPKSQELVAIPYRHGSKEAAEAFFLDGMTLAMNSIATNAHPAFPVTIYYAFKQSENKTSAGTASTGWEAFLAAVINAGFALLGTWPVRTESANRMVGLGANALASSLVLVCHKRPESAPTSSRSEFRRRLKDKLPKALRELERANIAPVDVAQSAIGPGMAIFSQSKAVLNPDDSPMSVREALIEINAALDEHLSQDEGSFDADTRFALTFFESYGYNERPYGDAEGLAVARNISVDGVAKAGILRAIAGKVQLLRRAQLNDDWDPSCDDRLCVWEATQQLIRRLEADGEGAAASLLFQLKQISGHGDLAANCRALAYRLYNHCEKTKQAEEARSYNGLVIAWPELERLASASSTKSSAPRQTTLI